MATPITTMLLGLMPEDNVFGLKPAPLHFQLSIEVRSDEGRKPKAVATVPLTPENSHSFCRRVKEVLDFTIKQVVASK